MVLDRKQRFTIGFPFIVLIICENFYPFVIQYRGLVEQRMNYRPFFDECKLSTDI